jgi:glycosyltransferase involved in cell wall biosynthesis
MMPLITFVVPAYNASATIGATLASVRDGLPAIPSGEEVEVVVVDDGSEDSERLGAVLEDFPFVRLLAHERNRGVSAARNTGTEASTGRVVTILDADDTLAPDWATELTAIVAEWPAELNCCFSACRDPQGRTTVSRPDYSGPMDFDDALKERYVGEYLPLFRGDYIRERGFIDLGMVKDCTNLSYLTFVEEGAFWMTARVLRIYHPGQPGSITENWTEPAKAAMSARCLEALLERYGADYRQRAPAMYQAKVLRHAVYKRLAGEAGAWASLARGFSWRSMPQAGAVLLVFLLGPGFCLWAVTTGKALGLIKRYG